MCYNTEWAKNLLTWTSRLGYEWVRATSCCSCPVQFIFLILEFHFPSSSSPPEPESKSKKTTSNYINNRGEIYRSVLPTNANKVERKERMRQASCATPGSTSLSPVLVQGGSPSHQLEWLFISIPFAFTFHIYEGAQQTWPGCSWENFENKNKTSSFLSSFSKHLDGIKSKKKENPTRSNELKNEKCQPKLAGVLGVTLQPFPPIELQLALFQSE